MTTIPFTESMFRLFTIL